MKLERISPMAYATVLEMAARNYSTDKGPWMWMVVELGWEPEAAWRTLMDVSDPFQDAVPCFQQQPTCYCPRGWHLNRWRHASLDYCKGYLEAK